MIDFHELHIRYVGDIYRFSLFLCRYAAEAEDITAETFARALTGKAPLVSATVKGYLLTIARNLHLEWVRRRKRLSKLPPDLPDSSPHFEHVINHKYMQIFSEVDRTALLLRANGVTYDEISIALKISFASAKVKVHRLRLKLEEWRANSESIEI